MEINKSSPMSQGHVIWRLMMAHTLSRK